ncbi:M48 family metalloprotease [Nitrospira sp. M1]
MAGTRAWYDWWTAGTADPSVPFSWNFIWMWDWTLLAWVAFFCLIVITLGCAIKFMELHAGGTWVAELLGGTRLDLISHPDHARTVFNVVEEMALASGIVPPPIYVLERELGINAFAAGHGPEDAVIGITRGAMTKLSREELQGVIGHEMSHILHGDIRLNFEMIGLLNGLQGLGALGRTILNSSLDHSAYTSNFFTPVHGLSIVLSCIIGVVLRIVGSIGVILASLIKAAISRQREFLADAASVQFTRNPEALVSALQKIANTKKGSVVNHREAPQVSHLFFSQGIARGFEALFAMHPPLARRIQRIDATYATHTSESTQRRERTHLSDNAQAFAASEAPTPESLVQQIWANHPQHVHYMHDLLAHFPETIHQTVHEPFGARAVVYTLLLSPNPHIRAVQHNRLATYADAEVYQEACQVESEILKLHPAMRLPLLDMAIPTLTQLSPRQYATFQANILAIMPQRDHEALFGWVLRRVLLRHLTPHFSIVESPRTKHHAMRPLAHHCGYLLSTLAQQGKGNDQNVRQAFHAGKRALRIRKLVLTPASLCTFASLDLTLHTLNEATPQLKRRIIKACAACVLADQRITVEEAELLRAIADSLGCPMPPLLRAQPENTQEDTIFPVPSHPAPLTIHSQDQSQETSRLHAHVP